MRRRSSAMLGTTASTKPSWEPRRTLPSGGSPTLRAGYSFASISAAPDKPSTSSSVLPSRTFVTMPFRSKLIFVSEKVIKRSMKPCISASPTISAAVRDSQKAPIRSRVPSLP